MSQEAERVKLEKESTRQSLAAQLKLNIAELKMNYNKAQVDIKSRRSILIQ